MPGHFDEMLEDVEFALAGASAHLDEILGTVSVMIEVVENPAELERVRKQLEVAASAIESVATVRPDLEERYLEARVNRRSRTSLTEMRIFVAGATGVLGIRVVPLLVADGHQVTGMTRSAAKANTLWELGADPAVCDVYDGDGLREAVVTSEADTILHLLTDLPDDLAEIDGFTAANARIRREGTRNLLLATDAAGASRFLAESVAWRLPGDAGAAVDDLERLVLAAHGVVLRYGQFYGPGTYHPVESPEPPVIHIDEAARRTAAVIDQPTGIIEIVEPN